LGEPTSDEIRQMQPNSSSMIDEQLQRRATCQFESRTLVEHLTLISQSDLQCVELCRRMLQYSPDRRLTALDVLVDRYYQEIHDDDQLKTRLALNSIERDDLFHSLSSRSIANENKSSSNQTPNQ
jgi:serine/threonine protein kinase